MKPTSYELELQILEEIREIKEKMKNKESIDFLRHIILILFLTFCFFMIGRG